MPVKPSLLSACLASVCLASVSRLCASGATAAMIHVRSAARSRHRRCTRGNSAAAERIRDIRSSMRSTLIGMLAVIVVVVVGGGGGRGGGGVLIASGATTAEPGGDDEGDDAVDAAAPGALCAPMVATSEVAAAATAGALPFEGALARDACAFSAASITCAVLMFGFNGGKGSK